MNDSEQTAVTVRNTEPSSEIDNATVQDGASPNQSMELWVFFVTKLRSFTTYLYYCVVDFVAGFISDVLSHPRVREAVIEDVVAGVNAFMDQEDIGTKMDVTARKVIYDREKAREASRALGKEVVPMVTGFVGGVASSFTPAALKKRKEKKKREKDSRTDSHFISSLTTVGFSEEDEEGSVEESTRTSGDSRIYAPVDSKKAK